MAPAGPAEVQLVALLLFGIGLLGAILRRRAASVLASVQLCFGAASLSLVGFGQSAADGAGQVFALLALVVVVANLCVGTAIVIGMRRSRNSADVEDFSAMRW